MSLNGNVINAFNNASLIRSLSSEEFDLYLEVIRLITEIREHKGFAHENYFEFDLSVGVDIKEFKIVISYVGINSTMRPMNHSLTIFPN